jgi:hypothetical protein
MGLPGRMAAVVLIHRFTRVRASRRLLFASLKIRCAAYVEWRADSGRSGSLIRAFGGFRPRRSSPLPNLFVSMLQRMGLKSHKFATSTGTMRGLDLA